VAPVVVDSAATATVSATATALAFNVPLPTPRPNYAPVAAPVQVAAAAPVPVAAQEADLPISAIAAERGRGAGSTAITEMLAATAADARADVVINPPLPSFRPSLDSTGERQVASVSDAQGGGDMFVLASLPSTEARTESAEL